MTLYVLSRAAELDLLEILVYLERQSPAAALRIERQLVSEMDALATLPALYQLRPKLVPPPFRVHVVRDYLVVYNPESSPMSIARILHGRRNIEAMVKGLDPDE